MIQVSVSPLTGRLIRRPDPHFFVEQIAKPNAQGQSILQGSRLVIRKRRSKIVKGGIRHAPVSLACAGACAVFTALA
jgi:hypothetical protein